MKKYLELILAGLMMTTPALADTTWEKCNSNNGGTLVTVGGQTFCKADSDMNWWSAYAWCEAIGGYLPSITELCPGQEIIYGQFCGQVYERGGCWNCGPWSSTPSGTDNMWQVRCQSGANCTDRYIGSGARTDSRVVVCLKK